MTSTWLLTWTTYGTWLPGDDRGFVTRVRDEEGTPVIHNSPGTACDADMPGLREYARSIMLHEPVWLTSEQAEVAVAQFKETAAYRQWHLLAVAVMANHVHIVVEAPEQLPHGKLLGDFKAYATRSLDRHHGGKQTWWTERGSGRLKVGESAIAAAVRYVRDQPLALVVWINPDLGFDL